MSNGIYIKQAIMASLCEHPRAKEYMERAFSQDNIQSGIEALKDTQSLKIADIFIPDDDGLFIIDNAASWKNFDKLVKVINANKESFTFEEFSKPLGKNGRSLIDMAIEHSALDKVFSLDLWKGNFDEMERLWYRVPVPHRKAVFSNEGLIPLDLKRELFEYEGRITPEDRLLKSGLRPVDVYQAFSNRRSFDELNTKLESNGDYLRKEYVMIVDVSGNTIFDHRAVAWNFYDEFIKDLQKHGEKMEVTDFVRQVSYAHNVFSRAAEHRVLNKVFNPNHWEGRLDDMLELWGAALDGWKISPMTVSDFDNAYLKAENLTYAETFKELKFKGKSDLLKPLNSTENGEKPVMPLGLKCLWDSFEEIQTSLNNVGDRLTVSDLRIKTGQMENTFLITAVKLGHFDKVVKLSKSSNEKITLDDFLSKDHHGNSLLEILAEKNQLAEVFNPDIWVGRVTEMQTLWSNVGAMHRTQIDFSKMSVKAKQATLISKKSSGVVFKQKKPKK